MATVLLIIHFIIAAFLVGVILLQKSEGGALGMGGGAGGMMTARGTANLLTRATGVLAALFFLSSLVLAILFRGSDAGGSFIDEPKSKVVAESTIDEDVDDEVETAPADAPKVEAQEEVPVAEAPKAEDAPTAQEAPKADKAAEKPSENQTH